MYPIFYNQSDKRMKKCLDPLLVFQFSEQTFKKYCGAPGADVFVLYQSSLINWCYCKTGYNDYSNA